MPPVRLSSSCVCQVDGQKYSGQGRSKKMARLIAAESALRNFIQLKDGHVLIKSSHLQDAASLDFTSDELLNENGAGGGVGGAANGNEWLNSLLSIHFLSAQTAPKQTPKPSSPNPIPSPASAHYQPRFNIIITE